METDKEEFVGFYEPEFYALSNFASFAVLWRGEVWATSEHAYQAAKFEDEAIQKEIREARSAHDAKEIARGYAQKVRGDWREVRVAVMEEIVRAKLSQHTYIKEKLLESGTKTIIENSPHDAYWGWGPNKDGENRLGKLWMKLREELR